MKVLSLMVAMSFSLVIAYFFHFGSFNLGQIVCTVTDKMDIVPILLLYYLIISKVVSLHFVEPKLHRQRSHLLKVKFYSEQINVRPSNSSA